MRRNALIVLTLAAGLQQPAPAQSTLNLSPSRVVGHPAVSFRSTSPNLVEGREFLSPRGVVVDRSTNPSPVYVSDSGNNRVLVWRDIAAIRNGAPADFVLGQVDMNSTLALGPGTARSGGFNAPGALAVDREGNLYVVDTGNNRILRFRKPVASTDEIQFPDLVIGQATFTTNNSNLGGFPTEKTLSIAVGSNASLTGIAVDAQGNLWFTDALNHRVLRYSASALAAGVNQPAADVVLGQPDFNTVIPAPTTAPQGETPAALNKTALRQPTGLAIDADGRLYVSDSLSRVVVYAPPLNTGRPAVRVAGLMVLEQGQPPRLEYLLASPQGLFTIGNRLGVVDPALHRIAIYDPFPEWPEEFPQTPSPALRITIGQESITGREPNRGLAEPSNTTVNSPIAAHFSGGELLVADTGNHRVLIFPQQVTGAAANRVLGQTDFMYSAPNLIDGRELFLFAGAGNEGGAVALDNRSDPPRLYVADTFNNRVLGYRDARTVRPGARADLVIGQNDLNRALFNAPSNNRESLNATGLARPTGLIVDRNGDLFVADTGNGRVLRFPSPFEQQLPAGERHRANLVLGQPNFNQRITDPSSRNMAAPYGVALTVEGHLIVSDAAHNRLLFFRRQADGQFVNGQAAERVIGQPDFFTVASSNAPNRLNSPRHLATDTDDRLYLADSGNNRVLVYDRITVAPNDPTPAFTLTGAGGTVALNAPQAVFVSPLTGEIWVANTRANRAVRFRRYEQLAFSTTVDFEIPSGSPLALTQDSFGNLYVADGTNRVAIHYNALRHQIAGNYATRPLSPGAIGIIYPAGAGLQFSPNTTAFATVPLPREIDDVQVLVGDQPVPLYFVSPLQINFLAPMSAPSSGTAEVQVVRRSTGQILAVSELPFQPYSPALFVQGGALEGQVAALNEDNTVNTPGNRAPRGSVVQLFGTGQGFIPNAPADGTPPDGPVSTPERPRVIIGGPDFVPDDHILYSGLAPSLVGVWQINVRIPQTTAPDAAVETVVLMGNVPSNRSGNNQIIRTLLSVAP